MTGQSPGASIGRSILTLFAALAIWEAFVRGMQVRPSILPAFSLVAWRILQSHDLLARHLALTFVEIMTGFAIGAGAGFGLGVLLNLWPRVATAVLPTLASLQSVPKVALAPLFVLWFGYGLAPKIFMAAVICFFPVVVNVASGMARTPTEIEQFFTAMNASWIQRVCKVRIPYAAPQIFDGLRLAVTFATVGAVIGEFANPTHGLGYLVEIGRENFDTPLQFAAILLVSFVGWALFELVGLVESVAFGRYKS